MLNATTIQLIKSTVPVLAEHGPAITRVFYQRLFERHPEMTHIFNQTNQKTNRQSQALAHAVYAAAANIDQLDVLKPTLLPVLHKHRSLQIKPEMYPIVGTELLRAIEEVLGDAATPAIIDAWGLAYQEIADLFMTLEAELYAQDEQAKGFTGYQTFTLTAITQEASDIKSFTLQPTHALTLPAFTPGQYVTLRIKTPAGLWQNRQYSLISRPGDAFYMIAVKRDGSVSKQLHDATHVGDTVLLSAPAGNFALPAGQAPVVLFAGGIGLTPLLAIADAALAASRSVTLHVAIQDDRDRAFSTHLASLETAGATVIRYAERHPQTGTTSGRLTEEVIQNVDKSAIAFVCGPEAMIRFVASNWQGATEQLHYEVFGPVLAFEAEAVGAK